MVRIPKLSSKLVKTGIFIGLVGSSGTFSTAKEGMWLPPMLKAREADMKKMGLEIPVEKLYNTDGTGLNNAVVLFGSGCTGEIISPKGLLLTNHHCGYGTVQGLSSKERDYFANGFWAKNHQEELPCPGLTVTFIRKMENVSGNILSGIEDTLRGPGRDSIIDTRIKNLVKGYKTTTGMDATIKPYYNGNQYWVILSETFRDIRLVGFPPNGIGQFGGDTDNWMWPRHTGDFSMFRVYAGKDNKPADYSKENKPYQTKQFFTINISGYKEGDFTMVYGFPGRTMEYVSSYQVEHVSNIIDPIRIGARTQKLEIWKDRMEKDREIFLKYTSKKARVSNGWKKWQGELRGLKLNNVTEKKRDYETRFQGWATQDESLPYADNLLAEIGARSVATGDAIAANEYIREAALGVELISQGVTLDRMLQTFRAGYSGSALQDTLKKLSEAMNGFYKNYDAGMDKDVFANMMPFYFSSCATCIPEVYKRQYAEQGSDYNRWANYVFRSMLTEKDELDDFAEEATVADSVRIINDPAWQLYTAVTELRNEDVIPKLYDYYNSMDYLNRLYMNAQMKERSEMLYPDANLTLRLTYGQIKGIDPEGPAPYSFQTDLDGAIAKDDPSVAEFDVPEKLKELHAAKDYGRWAENKTVPVGFLTDNHTSGGNSGSPVINGRGELIGTNFDRVWEGTMSDLYFDPRLCRNISVDIRYTLFVVEKFGGAGWLLKEMKLVDK